MSGQSKIGWTADEWYWGRGLACIVFIMDSALAGSWEDRPGDYARGGEPSSFAICAGEILDRQFQKAEACSP